MTEISIDGLSYNTIEIHPLDRVFEHALVKPLNLDPAYLAWLHPTSVNTGAGGKRPLAIRGPGGREVVFVDRLCELVLCIEKQQHPQHSAFREKSAMRTSDIRKEAFRVAHELYEDCSGELRFSIFDLDEEVKKLGHTNESDAEAIFSYLTSTRVMESPYIGGGRAVRFTDYGISVIESGIDRPDHSSGPFPPLSVVVGDISSGAQVAIGSGHFTQTSHGIENTALLRDLIPLLQTASVELLAREREKEATLLAAAQNEAGANDCDMNLLKSALGRFAKMVTGGVVDSASQALLAYCKAHGFLP
jgi:hypothetical protein